MTESHLSELKTRSGGFLADIAVEDSRIADAVLVTARYDVTAFADDLFDRLGIPCPPRLYRAVARRKSDYLAGRAMAQAAMICLGVPPLPVDTAPSRAPIWPAGVTGSISHARGRCAALLSRNSRLTFGVDVEAIAEGQSLTAILTQTLSPGERAGLSQGPLSAATNATLAFSAKEALFKALHARVGRHFGFDAAEMSAPPGRTGLTLILTADLAQGLRRGQRFDIHHSLSDTHVLTWMAAPAA